MIINFKINSFLITGLLIFNFLTTFSQDRFEFIDTFLIDCGYRNYSKSLDTLTKQLSIQIDPNDSNYNAFIVVEPFDVKINTNDYSKIDSFIFNKYKDREILSSQMTTENYGLLFSYVIKNPIGNPYIDKYAIQKIHCNNYLISFRSEMGLDYSEFNKFECFVESTNSLKNK